MNTHGKYARDGEVPTSALQYNRLAGQQPPTFFQPGLEDPNRFDGDKPLSEPKSAVPPAAAAKSFVLPPINSKRGRFGKLITEEIDHFHIDHLGQQQLDIDMSRSASGG